MIPGSATIALIGRVDGDGCSRPVQNSLLTVLRFKVTVCTKEMAAMERSTLYHERVGGAVRYFDSPNQSRLRHISLVVALLCLSLLASVWMVEREGLAATIFHEDTADLESESSPDDEKDSVRDLSSEPSGRSRILFSVAMREMSLFISTTGFSGTSPKILPKTGPPTTLVGSLRAKAQIQRLAKEEIFGENNSFRKAGSNSGRSATA